MLATFTTATQRIEGLFCTSRSSGTSCCGIFEAAVFEELPAALNSTQEERINLTFRKVIAGAIA